MKEEIKYIYPIAKESIVRISAEESEAHKVYPHSVDFIVPISPIILSIQCRTIYLLRHNGVLKKKAM